MSLSAIASRYASSLLELSVEQGKLEQTYQDMMGFKESLASRDLVLLLKSPIINASKKISAFKAVFDGKFDDLTMRFFELVINKGREPMLGMIADEFINQYRDHKNISSATLKTAKKISPEKLEEIKAKIAGFAQGKTIEITEEIDETLIGGFVIELGDKVYDASVKGRLNKIKKAFS